MKAWTQGLFPKQTSAPIPPNDLTSGDLVLRALKNDTSAHIGPMAGSPAPTPAPKPSPVNQAPTPEEKDYTLEQPAPQTQETKLEIAPPKQGRQYSAVVEEAIARAASTHGVDPTILRAFAGIESSGNPNARTGSYKGLYQLSDSEFAKFGGGNIFDPVDNANAAAMKIKAESADFKRRYGRDPTAADLYMIHQQGVGGADAHWKNPDQPAWMSMYSTAEGRRKGPEWSKRAIWGNVPTDVRKQFGSVDNITSRDFTNMWSTKVTRFGGAPGPVAAPQAAPQNAVVPGAGVANFAAPQLAISAPVAAPVTTGSVGSGVFQAPTAQTSTGMDSGALSLAQANIEAQKRKRMADLLNNMAYDRNPVGSSLEGVSRVLAAAMGGKAANDADTATLDERKAMADLLQGLSPLEQTAFATGDRNMMNSVVQQRLAAEREKARPTAAQNSVAERKALAEAAGLQPGTQEYNYFMANGQTIERTRKGKETPEYKNISLSDIEKLEKGGASASSVRRFAETFDPSYAGYMNNTVGDLAISAGKMLPGMDDSAATWWADYAKYRNQLRHELFGSALTAGEAAAWEQADITTGMQPDAIKKNLEIQHKAVQDALRKKASAAEAAGYNPEVFAKAYGMSPEEMAGEPAPLTWKKWDESKKTEDKAPAQPAGAAPQSQAAGGDALAKARAAIQAGADPEKVKQRLKDAGISTEGL